MGRQRQEHRVQSGACVQGEVLLETGVESARRAEARWWGCDMTDGWTRREERRGLKSKYPVDFERTWATREIVCCWKSLGGALKKKKKSRTAKPLRGTPPHPHIRPTHVWSDLCFVHNGGVLCPPRGDVTGSFLFCWHLRESFRDSKLGF